MVVINNHHPMNMSVPMMTVGGSNDGDDDVDDDDYACPNRPPSKIP